jgi:hypothetical protein
LIQPRQWSWETLSLANPFFGVSWATRDAGKLPYASSQEPAFWGNPRYLGFDRAPGWPLLCIGVHLAIAAALMAATVRSFDRCLGRVPEHGPGPDPWQGLLVTSTRRKPAADRPLLRDGVG